MWAPIVENGLDIRLPETGVLEDSEVKVLPHSK